MYFPTSSTLLLASLASLACLSTAAPTPQSAPSCANGIVFKASFSLGDGFANIDLQTGSVHCTDNERYTGDPTQASGTPSAPFVLRCDDGGATSVAFADYGATGVVRLVRPGGAPSLVYSAYATRDGNGVYQFVQQGLCPQ